MDKRWKTLFLKNNNLPLHELKKYLKLLEFKKSFKIINVVGTNGKGSIANYLAQGLESKGFKVGLFTSPHIWKPNERISVNKNLISDQDFFNIFQKLPSNLHFFAYLTLVALKYFEIQKCDYVVLEAGIGGKKDTTNIVNGDYGLITSVALDHIELLGSTLESIAQNKAGIINQKMDFIVPSSLQEPLRHYFKDSTIVDNDGINYKIRNKKLAAHALKKWFNIDFNNFNTPHARSEKFLNNGFKTYFDVAHNLEGIKESLKVINNDFVQVVICSKKNKNNIDFKALFKDKRIYYYRPNNSFKSFDDFEEIKNISDFFKVQNKSTLYIGSFYLIGDIHEKYIKKTNP